MNGNGIVLYSGPSQLDGAPIVLIAVGISKQSSNAKTGGLIQTYILRSNISPIDAVHDGSDSSICGDCRHRGVKGRSRSCYVNYAQGPTVVYKQYTTGKYQRLTDSDTIGEAFRGRSVRLGAYGDPTAVPFSVWESVLRYADSSTGYTHQWKQERFAVYKRFCMASCDTRAERRAAKSEGWRTFRVRQADSARYKGEIACPASAESGKRVQCADCMACNGAHSDTDGRADITIIAHGTSVMVNAFHKKRVSLPVLA